MATTLPFLLSKPAQDGVIQYFSQCCNQMNQQYQIRQMLELIDRQYLREADFTKEETRAKQRNLWQYDPTKFRNVTVPVVMPQVEAAVAYQASVFLTGNPIFGVVASPEYISAARQMEAIIADQSIKGGWTRQFMLAFRDGFKYNIFALEVDWANITTPAVETGLGPDGKVRTTTWQGNRIRRRDPYNTFWDTRYNIPEVHTRGEFAGYVELYSRVELKQMIESLPTKQVQNIVPAFESQFGSNPTSSTYSRYYMPPLNPDALVDTNSYLRTLDWMAWAGLAQKAGGSRIQYSNIYEVATLYGRIVPSDFSMRTPQPNTPQIWKFIVINGQVVIYAERMTNAHNLIPMVFGQPSEDGLAYQGKSVASNAIPFQNVASALMNSNIAARRRAVSDRGLYDPSRVAPADINSDNPSAKIPVRPAAYGKALGEAYYPIPFRDDQSANNAQEMQMVLGMADTVNGQNRARQGQFTKGNRTKFEFADIMSNANARDQMTAILIEDQTMTPIKEIIKINILQYQPQTELLDKNKKQLIEVDPVALRKAVMEFKVSDGLIPAEKLISGDELAVALQTIGSSPQIAQSYNIGPMFSYLMKTRGADLEPFEKTTEQIAYEQAVGAWQQTCIEMAKQNKELKKEQLPPQPTPDQFGYNPNPQGQTQGQQDGAA